MSIDSTTSPMLVRRRATAGTARTSAPPSAANAGLTLKAEVTKNPSNVSTSTVAANTGIGSGRTSLGSPWPTRSPAKKRRSTSHSTPIAASQGSAMVAPNRANDSPLAPKARRLVRFDTGSSSDAELARWVQA